MGIPYPGEGSTTYEVLVRGKLSDDLIADLGIVDAETNLIEQPADAAGRPELRTKIVPFRARGKADPLRDAAEAHHSAPLSFAERLAHIARRAASDEEAADLVKKALEEMLT